LNPEASIVEILEEIKSKRSEAEPNPGFMNQLECLHQEGFFREMADLEAV
jgi:hypothetical protein